MCVQSFISSAFLSRNRYFRRTRGIELQRKRARPLFPLKDGKKEKERENRIQFPPIEWQRKFRAARWGHVRRNVDHRMRCTLDRVSDFHFACSQAVGFHRGFPSPPLNHPLNVTWLITGAIVTSARNLERVELKEREKRWIVQFSSYFLLLRCSSTDVRVNTRWGSTREWIPFRRSLFLPATLLFFLSLNYDGFIRVREIIRLNCLFL